MSSMFAVDPPVPIAQPTDLPTCMYKVDSQYYYNQAGDTRCNDQHNSSQEQKAVMMDVQKLEQRQLALLSQLQSLKSKVQDLAEQHGVEIDNVDNVANVVIVSSPTALPLSIIILQKLLAKHGHHCTFSTHVHSSFTGSIPDNVCKWLKKYNTGVYTRREGLVISIMITNDDVPLLKVDGIKHVAITGDGNIARYLCRSFLPSLYDESDPVTTTEIDSLIDSIEIGYVHGSNREQNAILRNCNAKIGKSQWLNGDKVSLADIVLFSAIKLSGTAASLPSNVQRWFKSCASHDGFSELSSIL